MLSRKALARPNRISKKLGLTDIGKIHTEVLRDRLRSRDPLPWYCVDSILPMGKLGGKEKLYVECLSELLNVVGLDKIGRLKLLGT